MPSYSSTDLAGVCDQAAIVASRETGVPVEVLRAISLTETGRKRAGVMRPWPWTVNMEGKGVWFDTEEEARAFAYRNYKRGARSFDVGCFQLNFKWHGQAFSSLEEMFDPVSNAVYAARFMLRLYREKGDWGQAAGAYHSRTKEYAKRYEKRFNSYLAQLSGEGENPGILQTDTSYSAAGAKIENTIVRVNMYPLLRQNGGSRSLGSLVPLQPAENTTRFISVEHTDG